MKALRLSRISTFHTVNEKQIGSFFKNGKCFVFYADCTHKYDKLKYEKKFRFDVILYKGLCCIMVHRNGI